MSQYVLYSKLAYNYNLRRHLIEIRHSICLITNHHNQTKDPVQDLSRWSYGGIPLKSLLTLYWQNRYIHH